MIRVLEIDGSHGEGGGQILRTALTYSACFQRPVHIRNIRAHRRNPGLAAQHITCIRAAGAICSALIEGDELGSGSLTFSPGRAARPGSYRFDVASARKGGSAGSASLVMQTVLPPLALADGDSKVRIEGGTHLLWSPSFHFLSGAWLPMLRKMGFDASLELEAWGWFPIGKGAIRARIRGHSRRPRCLTLDERGTLVEIAGLAVAANLPSHIPQRMHDRASALLRPLGCSLGIETRTVRAACAGAGLFLTARYENAVCGFGALGARGKPAEVVAEEAAQSLLAHHRTTAAVDEHLADQLLVPLAMADGPSRYTVARPSSHLATNAWLIERFGLAAVRLSEAAGGSCRVEVWPGPPEA
jgi:RNA 3'-terminal phosphate cyclase (ATP)